MWEFVVRFVHTFAAIYWFGSVMFVNAVVGPALLRCDPATQSEAGDRIARQAVRITRPFALTTIVLGVVLGTVFGPIKSWNDLVGAPYGIYYVVALVLSIAVYLIGQLFTARAALSVAGTPEAERALAVRRVIVLSGIELAGLVAILACMVLMHFAEERATSALALATAVV